MYPHERSLVKNLSGKPFAIVGVNSDSDVATPQKLLEEGTVTWRSFQNNGPETPISEAWGVVGWPTIYVLDAKGTIRFKNVRGKQLDDAIKTLLEEMGESWPEFEHDENQDQGADSESGRDGTNGPEPEEEAGPDRDGARN